MNKTFLFVTLLIATSYALEHTDSLTHIVDQLVELNKLVDSPSDKIGAIISSIQSATHDSEMAFKAFNDGNHNNCESAETLLKDFVEKLKGDKLSMTTAVNEAKSGITKAEKHADEYQAEIKKIKNSLKEEHLREEKERKEFEKHMAESDEKLITVRHLKNIITDELVNAQSKEHEHEHVGTKAAKAVLVQLKTFTEKLTELKELLSNTNDSMFSVVVSNLLETVTEDNFSDQQTLRKILNSLNKIRDNLKAWRKKAQEEQKRLNKIHQTLVQSKLAELRSLGKLLVEARSDKANNEKAIQELTAHSSGIEATLNRKNRELHFFTKMCEEQNGIAKEIKSEFASQASHLKEMAVASLNLK